ncbi:MAG: hypothetical protein K8S97_06105, partial [Anaerolineae bacterium]|nr:hypothetical protein [Anaerolineae bacterium]
MIWHGIQQRIEWLALFGILAVVLLSVIAWGAGTDPAQAQGDRPPDDPETAAFIARTFTLQDAYSGVLCVYGDAECPTEIEVAVPCLTAICERPTLRYDVTAAHGTIQAAVEAAQPGDLVIVMPGTHNGVQIEEQGGADSAYIHIMGWGAPGSVIVATKAFEDQDWLRDHFYFIDAHHYMISNLTFAGAERAGVFVSGYFNATGHFAHHFIFDGIYAHDNGVWGLHTTST